jgi:3-oxoacyl-[acyl-carrier protein] reductase
MFSLKNKNALVTGASGGIGAQICHALANMGANLVISGTRAEVLENFKNELSAQYPNIAVHVAVCNLSDKDSVESLFPLAEEKLGHIDILVNNAGITKDGLIIRMKDDDFENVLNVNLTSCFRLSRAAAKSMMKRRYGRIINISSVVGSMGNAGQTNYCASKAGMVGFSKALAHELATRNITVNCVAPGFISSAMTEVLPDTVKGKILSGIPMNRMGSPEEIAASVTFLASDEAAYITGHTLHVNGGMEMI